MPHVNRLDLLKGKIYRSSTEADVRQGILALYDLDLLGHLEKHRIDYSHRALWIEMKLHMKPDLNTKCKVISQILHYLHIAEGRITLPRSFAIMDKSNAYFFNTEDFEVHIRDSSYFKDHSPSGSHPELEKVLRLDRVVGAEPLNILSEYDEIWEELDRRGVYEELK